MELGGAGARAPAGSRRERPGLSVRDYRDVRRNLTVLVPLGVLAFGLRGPLGALSGSPWGPADPWRNGDFIGGWWWWWACAERLQGERWLDRVDWPAGVSTIASVIPNPLDMMLLSLSGHPTALSWNLAQLGHLVALVIAAFTLARAAGAGPWSSAAAVSLVAASPVMLHEVAGGRPSGLVVWPGLLCLAALQRPGWRWGLLAGLLAAMQGVAYAWHGLVLVLLGACVVRSVRGLAVGVVAGGLAVTPYLLWLHAGLPALPEDLPAAGYTALPLAGLLGLSSVPPRFALHLALLPAALLGLRGGWRWLVAGTLGLLLAIGPQPTWDLGASMGAGPWAWVAWALPPAARLHHPVRATLLVLPVLGVAAALGLERCRPWIRYGLSGLLVGLALANHSAMDQASTYDTPPMPTLDLSALPAGPIVDVMGMPHRTALAFQTLHRRPILETVFFRRPETPLQEGAERLARGEAPAEDYWSALRGAGFVGVVVFDRFGDGAAASARVEEALGPPVSPGVWSLVR